MRPLVLLLVLRVATADWPPSPLFAMRLDGVVHEQLTNRTSDGKFLPLLPTLPPRPAHFLDQRLLRNVRMHLDKNKCRVTSRTGRDQLLQDDNGNVYLYRQFTGQQSKTVCSSATREKRQIRSQVTQIDAANINVKAFDSNVTIAQLINITSGQSMISVNERYVSSAFYSDASNVLIEPTNEFVNMSIVKPFSRLLIGSNSSQLDMTADRSDVFVRTNHSGDQHSYMMIQSGASNLSLTHGASRLQAVNATSSLIALNTWELNIEERLTIASNLSEPDRLDRYLSILLLTKLAHIQITLVGALVRIRYGQTDLEISPDYRTVTLYTGNHTVILNTVTSAFSILITESELDIRVPQDDAVLTVHPNTSDIIGRMGELSLMQIRPDANTTLRVGGNDGQPSTFSGIADAEIDVTSGSLGIEVMSNTNSIFAESNRSEALIKTNKTQVGIRARHARIDIVAGRPRILITTGNTTIEINSDVVSFGVTLLPPYTTPANIFTNIGPFDGTGGNVVRTTTPIGGAVTSPPSGPTTASQVPGQTTGNGNSGTTAGFTSSPISQGQTSAFTNNNGQSTSAATSSGGSETTAGTGASTAMNSASTTTNSGTGSQNTITTSGAGIEQTTAMTSEGGITTALTTGGSGAGSTGGGTVPTTTSSATENSSSANNLSTTTSNSASSNSSSSSTTTVVTVSGNPGETTTTTGITTTTTSSGGAGSITTTSEGGLPTTTTTTTTTGIGGSGSITTTLEGSLSTTTTSGGSGNIDANITTLEGGASILTTAGTALPTTITTTTLEPGSGPWTTTIDIFVIGQFNASNTTGAAMTNVTAGSFSTTTTTTTTIPNTTTSTQEGSSTLPSSNALNNTIEPSFPRAAVDVPIELLMGGSSTRLPFPAPLSPPFGGLTPSPSIAPAAPLRRARMANPPPSADYLLSVGVQVDNSMDSSTDQFYDAVVGGLHKGYLDGRRSQLGIKSRLISRAKRQAVVQNDTDEQIDIMLTSLDRTLPELVTTRFFVKSGENLVLATNAADTYSKLTNEELSAMIRYPVVESVKPVSVSAAAVSMSKSQIFVTVLILVAIAALLLIIVTTIVLCYQAQKRQVSLTKRILECYPQRSTRRTSPILPPVTDSLRERLNSRSAIMENMDGGDVVQSEDERADSRASSVGGGPRLAFIEYPAPPDSADGRLLLRHLSAKDRVRIPSTVDSPRSIVLPDPDSNYTNRRVIVPVHSHKVGPIVPPSPIPINNPEVWADEPSTNSLGEVPSRNPKENLFRVSATKSSGYRSTARRLLDSAFPLTTVDIERFIVSK